MPKETREKVADIHNKVGEIHQVRIKKTFWDELVEFIGGLIVVAVIIGILVAIF